MNIFSFPEMYERWLVDPLFRPWVAGLLDDVELEAGNRLLDVACGTGIVARIAKERVGSSGAVVGVDINPEMLGVARGAEPEIDWREGSADALPLAEDERFDAVVCQQGLQFFPDKTAAVRAMGDALAPDGRLAVATWRPLEEVPYVLALHRVAERHLGPFVDRRHAFGETGPLETLVREADLGDVRSMVVSRTIRFPDGTVFLRLNTMALVGMGGPKEIDDGERQRLIDEIMADSAEVMAEYTDEAGLAFELSTNVVTGRA